MTKQNRSFIRLGLFVIIGSVLLIAGIYFIGENKNLFGANFTVSAEFDNASGLQVGNNVRYSGINVGTVSRMELVNDSLIRVYMKLQDRVKPFLKKNAITTIGVDGIVGSALINIYPGEGSGAPIEDGDQLSTSTATEVTDIINTFGTTNDNINVISRDLQQIVREIRTGGGSINALISDTMLTKDLKEAMNNLRLASSAIYHATRQLDQTLVQMEQGDGLISSLLHDTTTMTQIEHILTNMNAGLSPSFYDKLDSTVTDLATTAETLKSTTASLSAFTDRLHDREGALGTILHDTTLAKDLQESLEQVEAGTASFEENMEALKHNFLFRGYFRRKARLEQKDSVRQARKGQ